MGKLVLDVVVIIIPVIWSRGAMVRSVLEENYFSNCSQTERKQQKTGLADLGILMTD